MKKFCFLASCLLSTPFLLVPSLSAQTDAHLGRVNVGASKTEPVEVSFTDQTTLGKIGVFTGSLTNADFIDAGTGSCKTGLVVAAGQTCTLVVKFSPRYAGVRHGAFVIANNVGGTAVSGYLQGTGVGPYATFQPSTPDAPFLPDGSIPNIQSLAVDGNNSLYIAAGEASPTPGSTFNGFVYPFNSTNGQGGPILDPTGVAVDGAANVYVAQDFGTPLKYVQQADGSYQEALLTLPTFSQAIDGSGNFFAVCATAICKETLQPSPYQPNGTYSESTLLNGFVSPAAVAVDGLDNLYILDLTPTPVLYKESYASGSYTQSTIPGTWANPTAVSVDGVGNVFVTDSGSVYKEALQANGSYQQSLYFAPSSAYQVDSVSPLGNVYTQQYGYDGEFGSGWAVVEFDASQAPSLNFAQTAKGSTSQPQTTIISNSGNARLTIAAIAYPADFIAGKSGKNGCLSGTILEQGASCNLAVSFSPQAALSSGSSTLSEAVQVTTNSLNISSASQVINLSGIETAPVLTPTTTGLTLTPGTGIVAGEKLTLSIVVKPTSGTAIPTGTVTLSSPDTSDVVTVSLDSTGNAIVNTVAPAAGTWTVLATYNGSSSFASSVSPSITTTVGGLGVVCTQCSHRVTHLPALGGLAFNGR